ncbi:unnamed protein product [Penicillium glandicola]
MTVGKWEFNMPVFNTSSYSLHLSDTETNHVVDNFTISADWEPENEPSSSQLFTTSGVLRSSHGTDTEFKTDTAASTSVTSAMSLSTSKIIEPRDETVMSPSTTSDHNRRHQQPRLRARLLPNPPQPPNQILLPLMRMTSCLTKTLQLVLPLSSFGVILWQWNMKRGEPSEHDDRFVLYYWPQSADPAAPNFQIATEGGFQIPTYEMQVISVSEHTRRHM